MGETSTLENVSEGTIKQLKRTQPWIYVFSIVGFLYVAISLFTTIAMVLTEQGLIDPSVGLGYEPKNNFGERGYQFYIFISIASSILYFFISYHLFNYARKISIVATTRTNLDLEKALTAQASFWKTLGIVIIVSLISLLLFIIDQLLSIGISALL